MSLPRASSPRSATGDWHACGIRGNGAVECWGWNFAGQTDAAEGSFTSVSGGSYHTCALSIDGHPVCWGDFTNQEVSGFYSPQELFRFLDSGGGRACGLRDNGTIACWNADGLVESPARSFMSISVGGGHACGVLTNREIECWDFNDRGQADPPPGEFLSVSAGEGPHMRTTHR